MLSAVCAGAILGQNPKSQWFNPVRIFSSSVEVSWGCLEAGGSFSLYQIDGSGEERDLVEEVLMHPT